MNANIDLARSAKHDAQPPEQLSLGLKALWYAKAGRWHEAHDLCQEISGRDGAWIHAHLHRQEGDLANAAYWYQCANQPIPQASLSIVDEWQQLAHALMSKEP